MPILLLILFLYLSLFHLFGGYIYIKLINTNHINPQFSPILFGVIFTLMDLLIGTLFGGFPWNFIGYSSARFLPFIQSASFLTIYGINFLLFLISGYIGLFLNSKKVKFIIAAIFIFTVNFLYGSYKLYCCNSCNIDKFDLSIVQTNTVQNQKWNPYFAALQLRNYISLTLKSQKDHKSKLILWPEASFPYLVTKNSNLKRVFGGVLDDGQSLLFGTIFNENDAYYNSLVTIDSNCKMTNIYHKVKLTPFGEYIPFRFLPFIDKIANDNRDFKAGGKRDLIKIGNMNFLPLICYEVIFPIFDKKYDYIINIANDAWFDGTKGIDQLFYISRFRAVESSTPLIRCSNAGISAIFDNCGRTIYKSKRGEESYFQLCN